MRKLYCENSYVVLTVYVSFGANVDRSYLSKLRLDFRDFVSCESKPLEVFKEV